jgi:hypothetical protein
MQVQPIQRPITVPIVQPIQQQPDAIKKVMTIEEAQAQIAKLRSEKRELDAKLTEALATIDQWTKKGGSLVHAYCASETLSRRSDGAGEEDCAASGYACSQAEGTCRNRLVFPINPNLLTVNCLVEWTLRAEGRSGNGITAFGEDHDNWSAASIRRHARAAAARSEAAEPPAP